jgi:DNA-binding LacI/PurR family transcriptional regulator
MAAEHLLALGHRRFAILALELIGDGQVGVVDRKRRLAAEDTVTRDRLLGYGDALAAAGMSIDDIPVVESFNDRRHAAEMAATLFSLAPDATGLLAMSDVIALAAMKVAQESGRLVPRDLSIVGFYDIPEAAAARPALTTVHQPIVEKGRRAADMIFDSSRPRKEVLPLELVVRASSGPAPG